MNSDSARPRFASAPQEYDPEFLNQMSEQIARAIANMMLPGAVRCHSIFNINNIPTSATGLRSGDVWSNAGVLTIVS